LADIQRTTCHHQAKRGQPLCAGAGETIAKPLPRQQNFVLGRRYCHEDV